MSTIKIKSSDLTKYKLSSNELKQKTKEFFQIFNQYIGNDGPLESNDKIIKGIQSALIIWRKWVILDEYKQFKKNPCSLNTFKLTIEDHFNDIVFNVVIPTICKNKNKLNAAKLGKFNLFKNLTELLNEYAKVR